MGAERVIHASIFVLLVAGLAALSVWAIVTYVGFADNLILAVASFPLCWGIILLAMYLCFSKLGWKWWK